MQRSSRTLVSAHVLPDVTVRRLFIPGYYSGFSNNKMSLDIAIVLAYLTGRVLVPYRFRLPRRFPVDQAPGRVLEPLLIPDLFDIPVPWSDEYLFKTWISVPGALQCAWAPVFESVLCFPATLPTDDARFQHFRNGRQYVYIFSEQQDEAPDLHISTDALGHYSYFFYLDEERRRQVVDLMKRLRPKRPYLRGRGPHCRELRIVQCHPRPPRGLRHERAIEKEDLARRLDQRPGDRRQSCLAHAPRRSARHLYRWLVSRGDLRPDPEILP